MMFLHVRPTKIISTEINTMHTRIVHMTSEGSIKLPRDHLRID